MRGSLPYAAVCNDLLIRRYSFRAIQVLELFHAFESCVISYHLSPRYVLGARNVASPLGVLCRVLWRCKNLSRELLWTSNIHESDSVVVERFLHIVKIDANGFICLRNLECCRFEEGNV